ncbi:MAG: hypothetical protein HOH43_08435 [Candidatus Latescibacteria bacterium]|nr:hypothetical protein [Candidatus Latescibacterota bacterium]
MLPSEPKIIDVHSGLRDIDADRRAGSCVMVIFRAGGVLTRRKTIPAAGCWGERMEACDTRPGSLRIGSLTPDSSLSRGCLGSERG